MSQLSKFITNSGPGGYVQTLTGDSGSPVVPSGGNINLVATTNSGSSVAFEGSGSTMSLFVTDTDDNTLIGKSAGNGTLDGTTNTGLGYGVLHNLTSGNYNVALGGGSGTAYTTESDNILIGNTGTVADANTIRIGTQGSSSLQQDKCFIAGITGVTVSSPNFVTIDTATGQLGATAGGGGGVTLDGDTGSATGSTITVETGFSTYANGTASFTGSGSNLTLAFDDQYLNLGLGTGVLRAATPNSGSNSNIAIGSLSGQDITSGYNNVMIGVSTAAGGLTTGNNNVLIGTGAGSPYQSSESGNTIISDTGVTGDNNVIRINTVATGSGPASSCYIGGIAGVTVSNTNFVTIDTTTGQLGSTASAGAVILTGDSGGAIGPSSSFTFDAITQAGSTVSFSGSGDTMSLNTSDDNNNTIIGLAAGNPDISGASNTGLGNPVFSSLTSGTNNVAIGMNSLVNLQDAANNTAVGQGALQQLVTGAGQNTAIGLESGLQLTSGAYNTFLGFAAGYNYTAEESSNICIGSYATETPGESNVIRVGGGTGDGPGTQSATFISGIQGITVTGTAVLVSSSDQLGVAVSSRKYKENIQDMADASSSILNLRPVTFTLKGHEDQSTQFGLIAEEVAEIMPDLIVYDKNGNPQTVQYHELPALLLNELQKSLKRIEALEARLGVCCGTK
jgi:hypothetical protein